MVGPLTGASRTRLSPRLLALARRRNDALFQLSDQCLQRESIPWAFGILLENPMQFYLSGEEPAYDASLALGLKFVPFPLT